MDKRRLVQEVRAMRERWGDGPQLCIGPRGELYWALELIQEGNRLAIRIVYPPDYPFSPPAIIPAEPLPEDTPHRVGTELCWHSHGEERHSRNRWDPSRDTAALCVGVAERWFLAFLVWFSTGDWPVKNRKSGAGG